MGVKACNNLLNKGANPEKTYTVPGVVSATVKLYTAAYKNAAFHGDPYEKTLTRHIPIIVLCEKDPDWIQPSKNTQITLVNVKFDYDINDRSCPVKVSRKVIVQAKKSGIYEIKIKEEGKKSGISLRVKVDEKTKLGLFKGKRIDNLGQMTVGKKRYKVVVPDTNINSAWKTLNIKCEMSTPEITSSKLLLTKKHLNGLDEGCPVKITATAIYETTYPGKFFAVIQNSYDKEWTETIEAVKAKGKTGGSFKVSEVFETIPVYSPKYRAVAVGHPDLNSQWVNANVKCQFKVIKATLKYDVPSKESCSKDVEMTARFVTTAPGKVNFRLEPRDGKASKPITIKSKLKDNKHVAVYKRTWKQDKINKEFRVVELGSDVKSKWKRLKVDCPPKVKPGEKELSN